MKQTIIFILAIISTVNVFGQQAFTEVSVQTVHNRAALSFTAANNVNVRQYRVEASNDNKTFKVIGTVSSKNNTIRPVNYTYSLAGQEYAYYRVAKVEMDGNMPYSNVICTQPDLPTSPIKDHSMPTIMPGSPVATR